MTDLRIGQLSAKDKLGAARVRLWRRFPYFMSIIFKLRFVELPGIGTLGVDKGMRCYYDPAVVAECNEDELVTLLAHELQHLLRRHPTRFEHTPVLASRFNNAKEAVSQRFPGVREFQHLANVCGDLEINDDLDRTGSPWPKSMTPLLPSRFNYPDGLLAEEYMGRILAEAEAAPKQKESSRGKPSSGGGRVGAQEQAGGAQPEGEEEAGGKEAADGSSADAPRSAPVRAQREPRDGDEEGHSRGRVDHSDAGAAEDGEGDTEEAGGGRDDAPDSGAGAGAGGVDDGGAGEPRPATGAGGCGSCAGNRMAYEEHASDPGTPDPITPDELELTRRLVAQAVQEFRGGTGRGTEPGAWLKKWAREMLAPPKVNAMQVLAAATRAAICEAVHGALDYKFGPPSRRREVMKQYVGNRAPLMPVLRGPVPRVVNVIDVSGSMGHGKDSRLGQALAEAYNVSRQCGARALGMAVDAGVQTVRPIRSVADMLTLAEKGHGGTDMRVGLREAAKPKHKADLIVLYTDGETPWPAADEMPRVPIVVIIVNENSHAFDSLPQHLRRNAVYVEGD